MPGWSGLFIIVHSITTIVVNQGLSVIYELTG